MFRTPLHIAALLGDDGIIRVLLASGADAALTDTNLDTPTHLAGRWCSREENYPNYKLVMTPLFKAAPKTAFAENKAGETPQMLLNLGRDRATATANDLKEKEKAHEEKLDEKPMGQLKSSDWDDKLRAAAVDDENMENPSTFSSHANEWMKEEIKGLYYLIFNFSIF